MVQLRTQRTALALYGVLLVLPTLVLGFLQWHQMVVEKEAEMAAAPRVAEDAAHRFREELQRRFHRLIDQENLRPFNHYAAVYLPDWSEITPTPSPLIDQPRPQGLLAWFGFDMAEQYDADGRNQGRDVLVDMYFGGHPNLADRRADELTRAARDFARHFFEDGPALQASRLGAVEPSEPPVAVLAATQITAEDDDCLRAQRQAMPDATVPMETSAFHVQFYREPDGRPRIIATRRVFAQELPQFIGQYPCFHRLQKGLALVQGFFIDPDWFFERLPDEVARMVLGQRQRFLGVGQTCCDGLQEYRAEIKLVSDMNFETYRDEDKDYGLMRVVIDTAEVEQRFRARAWRFFGVAAMLALSLSTGFVLMWRSIKSDLEQAQRTENFVAAVTHELRTPLASIRMHGEMLLDGWAKEPAKQTEYYRRIVRETERLSTLVERVLEKARLASGSTRPEAGDLSTMVSSLREELSRWSEGARPDLELRLEDDLPLVMLTTEAVRSIVVNLVENARKYAPVDFSKPEPEPILVVTRREGADAVLEVLDRGPGVATAERERIFQAFYRVGNEATRTSRGTGLGLHLVALHAASCGGVARVREREGGGAIFSVSFPAAPPESA